ncbi:programmed cell death 1 ligand 1-like isoform X2 [Lepisosteus oculatus]|uniref:programmed cell death 1 ligand 1-like isoform X2 n=1 Tax=Lepisosteus oculatus TaxID=7918 RepID=UPI0037128104
MLLWTLTVALLLCRVSLKTQADVRVVVPKSSVTGPYQNSVTLLCIFSSNGSVPIGNVSVRWEKRPNITVFAYENGQEQPDIENPAYRNRTSLFSDVTAGAASIVLVNLSLCDAGTYTCRVGSPDSDYGEGQLTLSVAAKPLNCTFSFQDYNSLSYLSSGWFPAPVVFWTDGDNKNITNSSSTSFTHRADGLYDINSTLLLHNVFNIMRIYINHINPLTGQNETVVFQQVTAGPGVAGADDNEPLDVNYQHEPTDSPGAAGADDKEPLIRGNRRRDSIDKPRVNM